MYQQISSDFYHEVALQLLDRLDGSGYYSGSFEFDYGSLTCRMVLSAVVYYDRSECATAYRSVVKDVVPVWWEFHTVTCDGEVLNDFSFNELREYIKVMC